MKQQVDQVLRTGDTVGGVFEVVAHGVPPGLGTVANWDERLDTRLAAAVMSLQAVKAVEIGDGVLAASLPGSAIHDEIGYDHARGRLHELHSRFKSCRGTRRRHYQRQRRGGARLSEADFDAAASARLGGFCHPGAGQGRLRALRRLRGAGSRSGGGSHGGSHAGGLRRWRNSVATRCWKRGVTSIPIARNYGIIEG